MILHYTWAAYTGWRKIENERSIRQRCEWGARRRQPVLEDGSVQMRAASRKVLACASAVREIGSA